MSNFSTSMRMLVVTVFLWGTTLVADSSVLHADIVNESDRATVSSIELIKEKEQLSDQLDNLLQQINLYDQKHGDQKSRARIASLAIKAATVSGTLIGSYGFMCLENFGLEYIEGLIQKSDWYNEKNFRDQIHFNRCYGYYAWKFLFAGVAVSAIAFYVAFEKLVDFLSTRGQKDKAKEIAAKLELLKKAFDELKADTQDNNL